MSRTAQVFLLSTLIFCLIAPSTAQAAPTAAELAVIVETNRVRAAHGLVPLRLDVRLERAARAHSRAILRRGSLSHGAFARRLASFGARAPAVGENLAWGVGTHATAQAVVAGWLASPSHRANLLRPGFRRIGVGRAVGRFGGYRGAAVVTADYAGR
jgi:uncharacterized protein YkwD